MTICQAREAAGNLYCYCTTSLSHDHIVVAVSAFRYAEAHAAKAVRLQR